MGELSLRSRWPVDPSPWAETVARARAAGHPIDLTETNPSAAGIVHPPATFALLAETGAERYEPEPLGLGVARRAVAEDYYGARGIACTADQVWITPSTSEAYAHLLTLLCDPGDAILVPRPGYPLLDTLAGVADVRTVAYPLVYDGAWHLDGEALDRVARTTPGLRAITVVSPGNPTGHVLDRDELARLERLCAELDLCLVVDEVFADHRLRALGSAPPSVVGPRRVPTAVLSGLSKTCALPQLKLAWTVLCGPKRGRDELVRRAEILDDAFLGTGTPVQRALPRILAASADPIARLRVRLHENLARLRAVCAGTAATVLDVEAGWAAIVRMPEVEGLDDLSWAALLLEHDDVLVAPGYLFDLERPPMVVVSLLVEPEPFSTGVGRIAERVRRRVG